MIILDCIGGEFLASFAVVFSCCGDFNPHPLQIGNPGCESEATKLVEGFDRREALAFHEMVVDTD